MFGRKKQRPPDTPFAHDNCPIVRADPSFQPEWHEDTERWQRECQCGAETWTAPEVDDRVRNDPYDPATGRHLGQCEFATATDPAMLRLVLTVKDGLGPGYWWTACSSCETAWPVPHYASERVG
jgi:hypothetical protein